MANLAIQINNLTNYSATPVPRKLKIVENFLRNSHKRWDPPRKYLHTESPIADRTRDASHGIREHLKMVRILVDLPAAQLEELERLATTEGRSRAAIIRDAIQAYIAQKNRLASADAFGLWNNSADGQAYQDNIRGDWEGPPSA